MLQHKGTIPIQTPQLLLRQYAPADVPDIWRNYATDSVVTKFLSWQPYTDIAALEHFLAGQIASYTNNTTYNWAIVYDKQTIGSISVINRDERNESCEIGYCIGRGFWGQGIMTEALTTVMDFLFNQVGFHRIFAKHDVENPASGKVMEKCRMQYEGRLRGHYRRHDGTFSDSLVYGALREDFSTSSHQKKESNPL